VRAVVGAVGASLALAWLALVLAVFVGELLEVWRGRRAR